MTDAARPSNRLSGQTSPYLLQHAHNPVEWYPWGEAAFARARAEDKPLLVSIGYSACHWCHVMEHESFEDEPTAALMNENFVCIKVDREERPDVDAVFMNAIMVQGEGGGWPLSAFCLPDGRPYFLGTYFPPAAKFGRPSFTDAAPPEDAEPLYERFCDELRDLTVSVETGVFGARMALELVNDGPVTIPLQIQ